MAEKMTLLPCPFCGSAAGEGLHGIPAVECSNKDCGASLHRYHREEAYVLWNMRHLTQPAQAVDVVAEWRPFYAAVIQSIAVLARARTIDDGPREAILRETVMGEVTRIRAALDRFGKTMTTAALHGKQP